MPCRFFISFLRHADYADFDCRRRPIFDVMTSRFSFHFAFCPFFVPPLRQSRRVGRGGVVGSDTVTLLLYYGFTVIDAGVYYH